MMNKHAQAVIHEYMIAVRQDNIGRAYAIWKANEDLREQMWDAEKEYSRERMNHFADIARQDMIEQAESAFLNR